ncbi:MAG: hypothetical protein MUO22_08220, partial [Sedimentisphaerales bacterium]|nr:hypothetical protein [Sedimentisphaerales bacterium]
AASKESQYVEEEFFSFHFFIPLKFLKVSLFTASMRHFIVYRAYINHINLFEAGVVVAKKPKSGRLGHIRNGAEI